MFHRDRVEKEYLPLFKTFGMGSTVWSPLASGLLSGKYNDGIPPDSRLAIKENSVMKRLRDGLESDDGRVKIAKVVKLGELATKLGTADATALTYNVGAHEKACFYTWADIPKKKIAFYFAVQSGGSFDIDVEIKDPTQRVVLALERERQGDYVFTANEVGEYSFCFSNDMSTFAEKMVDFEITVEHEKRAAQDDKEKGTGPQAYAEAMEEALFRLTSDLAMIDRMQKYFRTRENRNFSTVISTDNRIFWYSLTYSTMIVVMSMIQVYVVRTFFSGSRRTHV
ncbi:hypothetical protein BGZ65_001343 [Modicella reniformis]|uniref:GOLD domain-containing protein n=1 Tax=Modicella reniformis TaxID=1440133 RepID=A0A9P6IM49_9FUNG|nr:hypothetical protein BGZ65_001343 [Modicella reniformis]